MNALQYQDAPETVYRVTDGKSVLLHEYTRDLQEVNIGGTKIAYANSNRPCTLIILNEEQLKAVYNTKSRLLKIINEQTIGEAPNKINIACRSELKLKMGGEWINPSELNLLRDRYTHL